MLTDEQGRPLSDENIPERVKFQRKVAEKEAEFGEWRRRFEQAQEVEKAPGYAEWMGFVDAELEDFEQMLMNPSFPRPEYLDRAKGGDDILKGLVNGLRMAKAMPYTQKIKWERAYNRFKAVTADQEKRLNEADSLINDADDAYIERNPFPVGPPIGESSDE